LMLRMRKCVRHLRPKLVTDKTVGLSNIIEQLWEQEMSECVQCNELRLRLLWGFRWTSKKLLKCPKKGLKMKNKFRRITYWLKSLPLQFSSRLWLLLSGWMLRHYSVWGWKRNFFEVTTTAIEDSCAEPLFDGTGGECEGPHEVGTQ